MPSTITLCLYDIKYTMVVGGRPSQGIPIERGFWIGKLPRSENHRFVPPSNHWLIMPEKIVQKSKMCPVSIGFQHLKRSYLSAICHLRFYDLTSFDQKKLTISGVQSLNLSLIL